MRHLVILGGGTAGTMIANKLRHRLDRTEWKITVVDRDDEHHYQPGYLFVPFGGYTREQVVQVAAPRSCPTASTSSLGDVDRVDAGRERRAPRRTAASCAYDYLVIATGTTPRPDQTPGHARPGVAAQHLRLLHPRGRRGARRGARRLRPAAGSSCTSPRCRSSARWRRWSSPSSPRPGCVSAGIRDRVELVYVTPLDGAFTKPVASAHLGGMLDERKIARRDRLPGRADRHRARRCWSPTTSARSRSTCWSPCPLNMGADFVARSGLGDELNYVPVDKHTLLSTQYDNIFAIGDASDIPASKAGSVAHFSVEIFVDNFLAAHRGPADDRLLRRARQLLRRVRRRQGAADRLQLRHRAAAGQVPAPGRRPDEPAQGDPRQPPRASSPSARSTGTSCSPDVPSRCRPTCRWPASTYPRPTQRSRRPAMPTTTIDGHEIHVDDEGFMTDYDEWNEDLGDGARRPDRHRADRRALEGDPLPAQRLPRAGRDRDAAPDRRRSAASRPSSCSRSSPRSRPRRWPTSPGCPSPTAASEPNRRPS